MLLISSDPLTQLITAAEAGAEDDPPEMPLTEIESDLDQIDEVAVDEQMAVIEPAIEQAESEGLTILASTATATDKAALIAAIDWAQPVRAQLETIITTDVWGKAFNTGGNHLMSEANNSVTGRGSYSPEIENLINQLLTIQPTSFANWEAADAVRQRTLTLAGNFSAATLQRVKDDLIRGILPDPATGFAIPRKEVVQRIETTLNVARARAESIAQTETTYAYNSARVVNARKSALVEAMRFIAVTDRRTTDICLSRNGLIFLINSPEMQNNRPPLHVRCRSLLSPVMPKVNNRHAAYMADENRKPENRVLTPLPEGWIN